MLHCLNNSSGNQSDITVLERQRARMNQNASSQASININDSQGLQIPIASSPATSFDAISRTFSSPPALPNPKLTHSNKRKPHHPPIPKVCGEFIFYTNKTTRYAIHASYYCHIMTSFVVFV